MFENIINCLKKIRKKENGKKSQENSKDAAKERLHLVLMQDRANVSADFLELMKQEIINVIKKYIDIDENEIDVRLTNKENEDGTNGAPALYANIPILNIKDDARKVNKKDLEKNQKEENLQEELPKETKEENANKKIKNEKQKEVKEENKNIKQKEIQEEIKDKSQKKENKENEHNRENKEVKEKDGKNIKRTEQKENKKEKIS